MSDTLSAIVSPTKKAKSKPALYVGLSGDAPRSPPARIALAAIDRVDIGRADTRRIEHRQADGAATVTLALADARMSTQHARMSRLGTTWVLEDLSSKNGTWLGADRVTRKPLEDGDAFVVGHTALVFRTDGGDDGDCDGMPAAPAPGLATMSSELATRFRELVDAARSTVPIAVRGETGTGKELVARAAHTLSGRTGKFVAVNCGALSESLLEGELFGHKKGAYTGATDERAGFVRSADGGTLFLDEVAELPTASQAALLRVLQEREVVPVGGDRPVKVDFRLVTATHRDLDNEVEAGRFRADLRARMMGVEVALPPLRDRREDIGLLVTTLLERLAPGRAITFAADVLGVLYTHYWDANVRELEHSLQAALALAKDRVETQHLPTFVGSTEPMEQNVFRSMNAEEKVLRDRLVDAIGRHQGNLAGVARELGKDRTQIRRWMKRFGITRDVS